MTSESIAKKLIEAMIKQGITGIGIHHKDHYIFADLKKTKKHCRTCECKHDT